VKIKIQVVIEHEDETSETIVEEISCLQRGAPSLETLGLTLAEGKEILANLQEQIVKQQVSEHVRKFQVCEHCRQSRRRNGRQQITYRTLFGNLRLSGQRFYHCLCQPQTSKSFSPIAELIPERTAPEFCYLQAKWASLKSYGLTVKLLEEVLPLSANVATTMRTTHTVAEKLENELGEEQYMFIEGPSRAWAKLPHPKERLFVGIDGGFIRGREPGKRKAGWFEVIVGKSLLKDEPSKRFAFVQTYDKKPKRKLFETLRSHGMQMNQEITFLSDGRDDVRELQYYLNPQAEHILDWFHVTMKITAMRQIAKGIQDATLVEKMLTSLDQVKWRLWHGHVTNALRTLDWMSDECYCEEKSDAKREQLFQALLEYHTYIGNNREFIPNYAERYRYDEIISTAFTESAINEVVSKRMVKKQQMRWTKRGAHLLLQVRTKTLNDELRSKFENWYPGMAAGNDVDTKREEGILFC
jgi:hypothetical protein